MAIVIKPPEEDKGQKGMNYSVNYNETEISVVAHEIKGTHQKCIVLPCLGRMDKAQLDFRAFFTFPEYLLPSSG